jgi:cathepsin B
MTTMVALAALPLLAAGWEHVPQTELSSEFLAQPAVSQELVDSINSNPDRTWTAEVSPRFKDMTVADVVNLLGVRDEGISAPLKTYDDSDSVELGDSFDWREKMGDTCPSIRRINDQANCGSCWAFGSVEAMNSRMCIQSQGAEQRPLSEQYLVSCALGNRGCDGGQPLAAWKYFQSNGIEAESSCPYALEPCNHHVEDPRYPDCPPDAGTPACTCGTGAMVRNSLAPYSLSGASAMAQDLVQKGPVTVVINVFQDFPTYKTGIYRPSWPPVVLGGHALAIFGYGTEGGVAYWLVKNSWNDGWGENGWVRILKGANAAGIELGINSAQGPCAGDVSVSGFSNSSVVV